MKDLFFTKKGELLVWLKIKKEVRTSDVIKWGVDNYHNRAERDCRDLAKEGYIRRLSKDEKNFRYNFTRENVWVINE